MNSIFPRLIFRFSILLISAIIAHHRGHSQAVNQSSWMQLLDQPFDGVHTATELLWDSIGSRTEENIHAIIQRLEKQQDASDDKAGQLKLALLKLRYCRQFNGMYDKVSWRDIGQEALRLANLLQDDYLLQSSCKQLGDIYQKHGRSDTALFYLLKSISLAEELGYQKQVLANDKIAASSALYQTQNYAQCVAFCRSDVDIEKLLTPIAVVAAYNNSGLGYAKFGHPDSAFYFFGKAADYAKRKNWGIWEGIASGNMGDALHLQGRDAEALPYWQKDYDSSIRYGEFGNAGLTLAYLSRYQFFHKPISIRFN
ncbi:MAG: hypothetical protein EON98_04715 [Chitinophagaceae bacterium]|nr:MAG: hypothetical protein EON98_04715 [Chitinophagaceae bacterium]